MPSLSSRGDLDEDGIEEAVAFLSSSSGGSGTELYVAVLRREADEAVNVATALVGDRVKIRSATLSGGLVRLEVLQAGADDPMCCPGELATREWALGSDGLSEVATEVTGRLSLAALA